MADDIDLGKISLTPKGTWNEETHVEFNDVWKYGIGKFLALKDSVGIAPSDDGVNWYELSSQGLRGEQGIPGTSETAEEGFFIVDSNNKILFKIDANGVDMALLSAHLKELIKSIPGIGNGTVTESSGISETLESGFYIVDSEGKVAIKYDANGLDVAKLSTHFKSLLPSITDTLPFSGKTINILSDSITDFKQWTTPLKSYLGCNFGHPSDKDELSSWGLSGARFSDTGSSSMSVRYTLMSEADLVIVFGGTNDWGLQWSNEVGTFADRTQATFYGALHYTFSGLIAKYPTTPIVIMTPMHRRGEIFSLWTAAPSTYTANSSGITVNHRGKTFREYVNIIKEVAEFYSLPVIDVYGELGISAFGDNYTTWYNSDGIHPILEGGKAIAKFVISKLNNIYKQYNIS